jgi:hypothetical protein
VPIADISHHTYSTAVVIARDQTGLVGGAR